VTADRRRGRSEQVLEADDAAVEVGDPRQASSTPGMNEVRSSESCRMVSVWPDAAEDDLLVGDDARQPDAVDADVRVVGAAGAGVTVVAERASGTSRAPRR
jgi:hypothetical protein